MPNAEAGKMKEGYHRLVVVGATRSQEMNVCAGTKHQQWCTAWLGKENTPRDVPFGPDHIPQISLVPAVEAHELRPESHRGLLL